MLSRDASSQAASRAVEHRRVRPPQLLGRRASCAPRSPSAPPPPEMDLRMPGRRGVGEDNGEASEKTTAARAAAGSEVGMTAVRAAAARAAAGSAAAAARARDAPEVQGGRQYSQHWWFGL